ncbi:MAG: DnaD domain protein [Patescibacteria group bacterium]|jgi:DnaD/phage-associated family protein
MVKYRQTHTKILDSFDFNEMPDDFIRVCWVLLPLILDSEGRGIYSMSWIKSKMYPMRDDVSIEKLQTAFDWIKRRKMIVVYNHCGHDYFYIPTWKEHQSGTQKEAKSSLPTPELVQTISGVNPEAPEVTASASESESASESAFGEICKVYENNISQTTPFIADGIDNWLKTYPTEWIPEAIEEAVKNSVRNFKYCDAILKRWAVEGFKSEKKAAGKKSNPENNIDLMNKLLEQP